MYFLPQQSPRKQPCVIPTLSWSQQERAAILASWRDCSLWVKHSWTEFWCSWQLLSSNMKTSCKYDHLLGTKYCHRIVVCELWTNWILIQIQLLLFCFLSNMNLVKMIFIHAMIGCIQCIYFWYKDVQSSTVLQFTAVAYNFKHDWELRKLKICRKLALTICFTQYYHTITEHWPVHVFLHIIDCVWGKPACIIILSR